MMESNFYSEEFERLVREKTEQYKMYPSEKVWKGVHGALHTRRKWFIASMSFLVTGIIFFAGKELILPGNHLVIAKKTTLASIGGMDSTVSKTSNDNMLPSAFSVFKESTHSASTTKSFTETTTTGALTSRAVTTRLAVTNSPVSAVESPEIIRSAGIKSLMAEPVVHTLKDTHTPGEVHTAKDKSALMEGDIPKAGEISRADNQKDIAAGKGDPAGINEDQVPANENPAAGIKDIPAGNNAAGNSAAVNNAAGNSAAEKNTVIGNTVSGNTTIGNTGTGNGIGRDAQTSVPVHASGVSDANPLTAPDAPHPLAAHDIHPLTTLQKDSAELQKTDLRRVNWLQDYAVYSLPPSTRNGRKGWMLYFSPTVNYRNLSGGDYVSQKSYIQNVPLALMHSGQANDFVDHKPALGLEAGANLLYKVTRNLTLKMGLQFNYIRYTIKAYAATSPERTTIALNPYYGYYTDSITGYTSISNLGGKKQETLNNEYYHVSLPIGFEFRLMGNGRLQLNIAATIQPTYLLNTNSYLLTTDYSNYTRESSLFRRWNVNGGLEAFISYKTGGIRWQIGPELRYQLLSTYNNHYPIHEHLKEYGLKIGISKTIR